MTAVGDAVALTAVGDERPVHFVGIAGAGMSALAELLVRGGVRVSGCDSDPAGVESLRELGVTIETGHDTAHVRGARAVVVTSAVPRDHPELVAAYASGIPVRRRAEALAEVVSGGTVVAVAGTHGKTTTTVLTTEALAAADVEPTGIAGGRVASWGGNLRVGNGRTFVVEADEYDRSFLALTPAVAVVTNVEADHLDVYGDLAAIHQAFEQFIRPARSIVICADDKGAAAVKVPATAEVIRYGISSTDSRLRAVALQTAVRGSNFEVVYDGKTLGRVALPLAGTHNVLNALAAIGCGLTLGVSLDAMRQGLESFAGVDRRFQRIGDFRGVTVVDDYAHHPTEIAATLAAARSVFPGRRLVAAFQPHLFTRTRDFAADFAASLTAADAVFLCDIYPARERPIPGVTSELIAAPLAQAGRAVAWRGGRDSLASALAEFARDGDVILTIGAGDITRTAYELRETFATRA